MNIIKILYFGAVFFLINSTTYASDKAPTAAKVEEKKYSQQQYKAALSKELERAMKRASVEKLTELSKELLQKEEQLQLRELDLQKAQQELDISRKNFETKVQEFQGKQNKFIGCLDKQDEQREKRINHMVDVVANMKPEVAAQVLSVQETDLSVEVLGKLDASRVSKIFNLMDKEISARLQKQYLNMKK
jgi:flagellar motility protein MotE (MotC chaperone)